MKTWTTEGHLSDLALERWAAGETEAHDTGAIQGHLETCEACRAQEVEWRGLFHALATLEPLEPSRSFDDAVMAQLRQPTEEEVVAAVWLPGLLRRLRPVAVGAVVAWSVTLLFGTALLQTRLGVPIRTLFTGFFAYIRQLMLEAVIRIGAFLHLSGITDLWSRTSEVSGLGIVGALALMTVVSGLAIWMLYRVTGYQPSRNQVNA
jgi:anti-sigma factor RsiW